MSILVFKTLLAVAERLGKISDANMHSENFMIINGKTDDGRKFYVSLNIEEENKND